MGSLFTGKPNPGYLGVITFTPLDGSPTDLTCTNIDYDSSMQWTEASIFNPQGFRDHAKGLSGGMVRASGIWDTGLNMQAEFGVGDEGDIEILLNDNPDEASCSSAKCSRWHVNIQSATLATFDVEFILDNEVDDFSGGQFNNPDIDT